MAKARAKSARKTIEPESTPKVDAAEVEERFEFLRPLVQGWLGKINEAKKARENFDAVAELTTGFFQESVDFMRQAGAKKYFGKLPQGRFAITLQKAFELVALFGPTLYWENPVRTIKPRKQLQFGVETFLPPGYEPPVPPPPPEPPQPDPNASEEEQMAVQQQYQQMLSQEQPQEPPPDPAMQQAQQMAEFAQRRQQERMAADSIRNQLYSLWLNYTPNEMPAGGLSQHAELAITQALVVGRGVLWPDFYKMPGSNRRLTGLFFDDQKNLWYDPDATSVDDATWIVKQEVKATWKVEREFGLKAGSLKSYGNKESGTAYGESKGNTFGKDERKKGKTQDLMTIYKVWSKMGCGTRLSGVNSDVKEALEDAVGDYAYIVVSEGVPYPLNAPSEKVWSEKDKEGIERMFRWPIPFWQDDKWPFVSLEFYRKPGSPYPIAPLAPGLGELAYLTVLTSHLANRVWSSSRDFIAILQSAANHCRATLESGGDLAIIELPQVLGKISECVQFLQQPQLNPDAWRIREVITQEFEKRVGLNELLYGMNAGGTQSRTATDIEAKREMVSVRPDYMAKKVQTWMSEGADMEKAVTRWHIEAEDVKDLLGDVGSYLWTKHVTDEDPELVLREMRATIEAGSARKPNKARDAQNMNAILPVLTQMLDGHANVTSDTNPLNTLISLWGDAIDQDTSGLMMGPRSPAPPPPEQAQMMEQQTQLQMAKLQADLQASQIDAQVKQFEVQRKQLEVQGAGVEIQTKQQMAHLELQADMQRSQMELQTQQQKAALEMQIEQQKAQIQAGLEQQKIGFERERNISDLMNDRQKFMAEIQQDQIRHGQEAQQDQQRHQMEMSQGMHEHMARMDQASMASSEKLRTQRESSKQQFAAKKQQSQLQTQLMKQKARQARPTTNGSAKK